MMENAYKLIILLASLFAGTEIATSEETRWNYSCNNASCYIAKFNSDPKVDNLDVGFSIASEHGEYYFKVIAPLGAHLGRGVTIDFDLSEPGFMNFERCDENRCYASSIVTQEQLSKAYEATEIGITVWNEGDSPFRTYFNADGLKEIAITSGFQYESDQSFRLASVDFSSLMEEGSEAYFSGTAVVPTVGSDECLTNTTVTYRIDGKDTISDFVLAVTNEYKIKETNNRPFPSLTNFSFDLPITNSTSTKSAVIVPVYAYENVEKLQRAVENSSYQSVKFYKSDGSPVQINKFSPNKCVSYNNNPGLWGVFNNPILYENALQHEFAGKNVSSFHSYLDSIEHDTKLLLKNTNGEIESFDLSRKTLAQVYVRSMIQRKIAAEMHLSN